MKKNASLKMKNAYLTKRPKDQKAERPKDEKSKRPKYQIPKRQKAKTKRVLKAKSKLYDNKQKAFGRTSFITSSAGLG